MLGQRGGLASSDAEGQAEREEAERAEAEKKKQEQIKVANTKGVLELHEIQAGLAPHQAELPACLPKQKRFLGGDVRVYFKVLPTGQVGTARVVQSDLGDWDVEHCVLELARKMKFAEPKGGNRTAEFQVPFHLENDQANVEVWPEERIAQVVAAKRGELDACAGAAGGQAPGEATVTLYIGNRGAVQSVGVASADAVKPVADAWASCAARAVAAWTFADPQGKIVKTAFKYRPGGQ